MQQRGVFVSLEGIDGCGKTTLKEGLLSKLTDNKAVCIREPGGTEISEKIRDLLLDVRNHGILPRTEAMLYAAARCQVVQEMIAPALKEGKLVIADRFTDSTLAYQGYGRGLDITFLNELNHLCTGGIMPDLTLLLDLDPREACRRRTNGVPDRLEMEGIAFQTRVRDGYLKIWEEHPERMKKLDAGQPIEDLLNEAWQYIQNCFQSQKR